MSLASTCLLGGQVGDLLDALGVEDVVGVELAQLGLLEVVDRRVVEDVAVEVGADVGQDLVLELLAFGVLLGEVEWPRRTVLRASENLASIADEGDGRRPGAADGTERAAHVARDVAQREEGDLDVGPSRRRAAGASPRRGGRSRRRLTEMSMNSLRCARLPAM